MQKEVVCYILTVSETTKRNWFKEEANWYCFSHIIY